ncbi:putative salivary gland protein 11 [Frankliniella occidentalis]|nr:putative salivary gland protein 11 [Frankliniella occidentalis]
MLTSHPIKVLFMPYRAASGKPKFWNSGGRLTD